MDNNPFFFWVALSLPPNPSRRLSRKPAEHHGFREVALSIRRGKILLHPEFADLGVEFLDGGVPLRHGVGIGTEQSGHARFDMPTPFPSLVGMH